MGRTAGLLICAFLLSTFTAAAQQAPPMLSLAIDQWKSAMFSGNVAAAERLYSTNPPGHAVGSDGKPVEIRDEADFYRQLISTGARNLQLKIIDVAEKQGVQVAKLEVSFRTNTPAGLRERYVLEQQAWQQQPAGWRLIASTHTQVLKLRPVKMTNNLYKPNADAKAEITEALSQAARAHKRVMLVFGGNWCYDCHVLDAAFHQPDLASVLNRNFIVVHVDVGNYDKNLDLADKYKVPLNKGVPALAVLASDGSLLYSQQHGEFESARSLDPDDLIAFANKWKPGTAGGTASR
jgi:hypothetical protein